MRMLGLTKDLNRRIILRQGSKYPQQSTYLYKRHLLLLQSEIMDIVPICAAPERQVRKGQSFRAECLYSIKSAAASI